MLKSADGGTMEVFNVSGHLIKPQVCSIENDKACVLLYVLLASFTAVMIAGNLLVVVAILYFKQLHTPTNYLILSLAVTDLLIGVLVFPLSIFVSFTPCDLVHTLLCKVAGSFDFTLAMSSVLNLCCISVDRYHAVCHPLLYSSTITDRSAAAMGVGSWAASALFGAFYLCLDWYYDECAGECFAIMIAICLFAFYMPIGVLMSVYCKIFAVARAQARSMRDAAGPASGRSERKATRTMAVVVGLFLLCWLPLFVTVPIQNVSGVATMLLEPFNWLAMSNSMFNPFIYAFFYKWFRSAGYMIVSGKVLRGDLAHAKLR